MQFHQKLFSLPKLSGVFITLLSLSLMKSAQSEGLMVPLVPVDSDKMVIAPPEDIPGWNTDFNLVDTSWTLCSGQPGGIGFDNSGDYNEHITLNIGPQMQGWQNTCFVRAKFDLSETVRQELDYLHIGLRYDDGFIAYLNGEQITAANAPNNPGWRSSASQPHEAESMVWFDVSEHIDKLRNGDNLFAVHAMNVDRSSPDFLIQFELAARKNYKNNFVSTLPIIKVDSDGNIPINANTVREGTIRSIDNGTGNDHRLGDDANDYSGRLSVTENATMYDYPKNHYMITLRDDQGEPTDASLLGLPAGDEWILYAPYNDKTLLRNVLMGELAHQMDRAQAPKMCHLFVNDDYLGLYVLIEKNKFHVNRINISETGDAGDALTGGYIVGLGKNRVAPGYDSPIEPFFQAQHPVRYLFNYPDASNLTTAQQEYIQNYMNRFENDVVNSIDIASAVDYFLLNEMSKNVDAYRDHILLYKDRDSVNPKMFVKSPLDFNNACGNTQKYDGDSVKGWLLDYLATPANIRPDSMYVPLWWQQLFDDVNFTRTLYKRWDALNDNILSEDFVTEKLDSLYDLLYDDGILNFERWPVAGKPIKPFGTVGDTYDEDYDYLYLWMIDRLDWMKEAMQEFITGIEDQQASVHSFSLDQNYPNPFNPQTTITYELPRQSAIILRIYDVRGARIAELVNTTQPAGRFTVQWDASGLASGVYFYKISAGEFSRTKRMLLMR